MPQHVRNVKWKFSSVYEKICNCVGNLVINSFQLGMCMFSGINWVFPVVDRISRRSRLCCLLLPFLLLLPLLFYAGKNICIIVFLLLIIWIVNDYSETLKYVHHIWYVMIFCTSLWNLKSHVSLEEGYKD